jgi:hypothetical protein
MPKAKSDDNDNTTERDRDSKGSDENDVSDSSNELEPVKSKKGEPDDNLRRRSEWFQKRHS